MHCLLSFFFFCVRYILYKLLTLKRPILWMDSDLVFEKVPDLVQPQAGRKSVGVLEQILGEQVVVVLSCGGGCGCC